MGPDGWSRQHNKRVHRKSRVRVWLGGADAAHVILAARTALSAGLNHAKSQRDAPLISLSITIFYPMTSDSTKKLFSLCSTVIVHLVSIWGSLMFIKKKKGSTYGRTDFMETDSRSSISDYQNTAENMTTWYSCSRRQYQHSERGKIVEFRSLQTAWQFSTFIKTESRHGVNS